MTKYFPQNTITRVNNLQHLDNLTRAVSKIVKNCHKLLFCVSMHVVCCLIRRSRICLTELNWDYVSNFIFFPTTTCMSTSKMNICHPTTKSASNIQCLFQSPGRSSYFKWPAWHVSPPVSAWWPGCKWCPGCQGWPGHNRGLQGVLLPMLPGYQGYHSDTARLGISRG